MKQKYEGGVSSLGALLVLFTAMLDPKISIGIAVVVLVALSIYHFTK